MHVQNVPAKQVVSDRTSCGSVEEKSADSAESQHATGEILADESGKGLPDGDSSRFSHGGDDAEVGAGEFLQSDGHGAGNPLWSSEERVGHVRGGGSAGDVTT